MAVTGVQNAMMGFSSYRGPQPDPTAGKSTANKFAAAGLTLPGGIAPGTPAADGYMKSRMLPNSMSTNDQAAIDANRTYWLLKNSTNPNYNGPDPSTLTGPAYNASARSSTSGILTSGGRPLGGGYDQGGFNLGGAPATTPAEQEFQTSQRVSSIFDQIKATPGVDNFRAGVKSAFETLMQPQSILLRLRGIAE